MHYLTLRQIKNGLGIHFSKVPGDDEGSGGSGGGNGSPPPKKDSQSAPNPEAAARIAELEAELKKFKEAKPNPDDASLHDKAQRQREADDKSANQTVELESAIKFNLDAENFLKQNERFLPKEIGDIFAQANKEKFNSPIEKARELKASTLQGFFSLQANVDLLTAGQKAALDDYLKLTKNGKQEKAQQTFDMIFEPALEMLKKIKKAEALSKGHAVGGENDAYKSRIIAGSKRHYLGEK